MKNKKNKTNNSKVELKNGLEVYAEKLRRFFGEDYGIAVDINKEDMTINLIVPDTTKAKYLAGIINRHPIEFNENPLQINGTPIADYKVPSNVTEKMLHAVFDNNHHFSGIMPTGWFTCVMFKPEVIALHTDNLGSPFGITTFSAEALAQNLLEIPGSYSFCTDYSK